MNIRKNIDYSDMFTAMDAAVDVGLSQMKLYCELGRLVCERPEKVRQSLQLSTYTAVFRTFPASPLVTCAGCGSFIGCMQEMPSCWRWP